MKNKDKDNEIIICRCEDVTLRQIKDAIDDGYDTIDELKRILRCGMGPCRGTTCIPLIRRILASHLGKDIEEIALPTTRQPTMAVKFESILEGAEK